MPLLTAADVEAYFKRIGYVGSRTPDLALLSEINRLHTQAIAFENIDVVLGRPLPDSVDGMFRKLVHQKRGGYCFEHVLPLLEVLRLLGFQVDPIAAKVLWQTPADAPAPDPTHLLLLVHLEEGPHLLDVAFGGLTLTSPIPLVPGVAHATSREPVRIVPADEAFDLQVLLQGNWKPLHRFSPEPVSDDAIARMHRFAWTDRRSIFTTALICARVDDSRRYNLMNNRLNIRQAGGGAVERRLSDGKDLSQALRETFLIIPPPDIEELWG